MKKIFLIEIFALLLVFIVPNAYAYINCTTSACPSGYTDNGEVCQGSTCIRNCTAIVCVQDWNEVFSDTTVGFDDAFAENQDTSSGYNPSNAAFCYNFTYQGPPDSVNYRRVNVDNPVPSGDCDTEAIGGFWDDSQRSNPWFSGMNSYIGNVGDSEYDYLRKIMRAHAQASSDDTYHANVVIGGAISCAPTTVACSKLGGTAVCDTDCYNRITIMKMHQGYYNDTSPSSDSNSENDNTLYADKTCGDNLGGANDFVDTNRLNGAKYFVYQSTTTMENNDQSCDRTHEAPSVSSVGVIPEIPNAGQDLLCNYTYSDPENFTEQNSSYEWWKNGVNQNINSQKLAKNNLTPGDQWYCKVTPSDGLLFGTQLQSTNTVTIRNTTQNPVLYINNSQAWNQTGYFGNEEKVFDFNQKLNNVLANCGEDAEGFCNVSLTFSSNDFGALNLSDFGIYYTQGNLSVVVSLKIEFLTTMYTNGTLKIFEFVILNDGDTTVTDIQWQFDTGNNNVINSTSNISSLATGEKVFVYVQYNYSDDGSYNVKANATGLSQSTIATSSLSSSVSIGDLLITSFDDLSVQGTNAIFESIVKNNLENNITDINWSLDTNNNQIINATELFNLTSNESIKIVEYSIKNKTKALVIKIKKDRGE